MRPSFKFLSLTLALTAIVTIASTQAAPIGNATPDQTNNVLYTTVPVYQPGGVIPTTQSVLYNQPMMLGADPHADGTLNRLGIYGQGQQSAAETLAFQQNLLASLGLTPGGIELVNAPIFANAPAIQQQLEEQRKIVQGLQAQNPYLSQATAQHQAQQQQQQQQAAANNQQQATNNVNNQQQQQQQVNPNQQQLDQQQLMMQQQAQLRAQQQQQFAAQQLQQQQLPQQQQQPQAPQPMMNPPWMQQPFQQQAAPVPPMMQPQQQQNQFVTQAAQYNPYPQQYGQYQQPAQVINNQQQQQLAQQQQWQQSGGLPIGVASFGASRGLPASSQNNPLIATLAADQQQQFQPQFQPQQPMWMNQQPQGMSQQFQPQMPWQQQQVQGQQFQPQPQQFGGAGAPPQFQIPTRSDGQPVNPRNVLTSLMQAGTANLPGNPLMTAANQVVTPIIASTPSFPLGGPAGSVNPSSASSIPTTSATGADLSTPPKPRPTSCDDSDYECQFYSACYNCYGNHTLNYCPACLNLLNCAGDQACQMSKAKTVCTQLGVAGESLPHGCKLLSALPPTPGAR